MMPRMRSSRFLPLAAWLLPTLLAVSCASTSGTTTAASAPDTVRGASTAGASPTAAPGGGTTVAPGCGVHVPGRTLHVVTTTTQLTDFVSQIGGDGVQVYGVLKPNVDPHDYEPSPADLDAIATADVVVKNGVGLEAWFDKTIEAASPAGTVVDASQGVPLRQRPSEDASAPGATEDDPHIWHNPQNAKQMVANASRALVAANPEGAVALAHNTACYDDALDALDASSKAQIDSLSNKKLVTNHDAFGYYVDRYGLDFVGSIIPSFDTSAELSATEIDALVAKIRDERVKAVFSESSIPPKTADAIGREAGVRIVEGDDSLYGDTLGPAGSAGATYLDMETHNTRVIVANLS